MPHRTAPEGYRALICAPFGHDAQTLVGLLSEQGYDAHAFADLRAVAAAISDAVGAIVITEESLRQGAESLRDALAAQPTWSDVPFIALAARSSARGTSDGLRIRLQAFTNNALVLERPLGSVSILTAVASAFRARQRQFEVRDRLDAQLQAQQALSDAAARLEHEVKSRTAELEDALARLRAETAERERAEASLRQSQKMEAVGQLTGGIAHDFNNMLTGVIGSLDLMRRRIEAGRTAELGRYMDAATASAARAAALTQRLLAFSRRQSLDAAPVDINALVESMRDLIERAVDERIELRFALAENLPTGLVDRHQFENAILNLAINARDAMPEGGVLTLETSTVDLDASYVRAKPGIDPGRYVMVAVSDTGVGMSPELIEKAFDPFFTTKPLGQGTGLGLSMVYGFAKQSGGQVRIHSQEGVGTSVKLYLPTTQAVTRDDTRGAPVATYGAGEHVVVVEDDPAVRMLIREVLEELGYSATEFADPLAAMPYLASDTPVDLLISDVGLPGMNGRELAERVRAIRPDLPILFVTGYAENAAIRAGFLGANMAMVTKPFAFNDLAEKISTMLNHPTQA